LKSVAHLDVVEHV